MKRLFKTMWEYRAFYAIALLALFAALTLDMFDPVLRRMVVDDVIMGGRRDQLTLILGGFAGITFFRAVLGYVKEYFFDTGSSRIVLNLRQQLFRHIQGQDAHFFDRTNTGELMSRIKEDIDNVLNATAFGFMLFVEQSTYFVVASVLMLTLNWKMALICLALMPLILLLAFRLEKRAGMIFGQLSDQRAAMNTVAQENLAGVRLVKAFGRERHEIKRFLSENQKNYELNVGLGKVFSLFFPTIEFLSNLAIVMVCVLGGILTIGGEMSVGTYVAFGTYIYMLIWPMRMMGWITNVLSQCRTSMQKINELFEQQPQVRNPESPVEPVCREGRIVYQNAGLQLGEQWVLKDLNITVEPGKTLAVMGATGAGKTSLVNLLTRAYDTSEGAVIVDGVDVRQQDVFSLRGRIAVVMQETFLFSDTIRDNVLFGQEESDEDAFASAVQDAKVSEFVYKMKEGYETVIGERGLGLSGGQKQRVSLARALSRDADILVLDDTTSALDMETEFAIQKAIATRTGQTKIIIAHRVSAVRHADEIVILENGMIVERGNHKSLMTEKGRYYETWKEQLGVVNEELTREEVV